MNLALPQPHIPPRSPFSNRNPAAPGQLPQAARTSNLHLNHAGGREARYRSEAPPRSPVNRMYLEPELSLPYSTSLQNRHLEASRTQMKQEFHLRPSWARSTF